MSAVESALDVLSRAATMMQEERPKTTNLHRKPTSGWRRERRKDPIQSETRESIMQNEALDMSATTRVHHHHHHHHPHSRPSVIVPTAPQPGTTSEDTAKSPTPSATPSLAIGGKRTGVKSANGGSDPAIDEHFKRSLGPVDYAAVFNESIDAGGLSVDDHFKKALGPNWESLNKKDTEKLS